MTDAAPSDLAIGIDIGGTKIAAVVVDSVGHRVDKARRPTPGHDAAQVEDAVVDLVDELRGRQDVSSVGVAVAGLVDPDGVVMDAVHLAMDHHPLRARLQERIGMPVQVENDGTAAAWAEYRFGKGAGADPLLVVTVGTGLGGGLVVGGKLIRGAFGTAGEVGHVVIEREGGRPCPCGDRGCLEQYSSGRALVREARRMVKEFPGASHGLVERCGETRTSSTVRRSPMPPARATPVRSGCSRRSATHSAAVSRRSPTCSTRSASCSAEASRSPATCCSSRRSPSTPSTSSGATSGRSPRSSWPGSATTRVRSEPRISPARRRRTEAVP